MKAGKSIGDVIRGCHYCIITTIRCTKGTDTRSNFADETTNVKLRVALQLAASHHNRFPLRASVREPEKTQRVHHHNHHRRRRKIYSAPISRAQSLTSSADTKRRTEKCVLSCFLNSPKSETVRKSSGIYTQTGRRPRRRAHRT